MIFGRAEKEPTAPTPVASAPEGLELQRKNATPSKSAQTILPDSEYYGLASVTVEKIPDLYQDVSAVTAIAPHVLAGDVFIDATGAEVAGTMPDNGAVNVQLQPGNSYAIPEGYHSGGGLVNAAVGDGSGLNYAVIGGTVAPASPRENTVWINTATEISSHVFASIEPENPAEGMVWISTGTTASAPFNAISSNVLMVYPNSAQQYRNGAWVSVSAKTYQNGLWVDWYVFLFNRGEINTELTGGIYYPRLESDSIYYSKTSVGGGTNETYTTKGKIDLTDIKVVKMRFLSSNTTSGVYLRLGVMEKTSDGSNVTTSNMVANARETGPFNGVERVCELDVSDIAGEYYLSYSFGVLSSSAAGNINNRVYEWWYERW